MAFKIALAGLGAALVAWLVGFGATTHLQRACVLQDTPYLPLCPPALAESDPGRPRDLRARLRDNPGDSGAWVELASLESDESHAAALRAVAVLAPTDPNSLRLRVRQALADNQIEPATDLLVKMTEARLGGEEPPQMLARLLAGREGMALLRPHLNAGSDWVPQVLAQLAALKLPLGAGVTLLAEAAAKGLVPPGTVRAFVHSLKASGQWADAYGLWVAQQRQPVPLLFNGGFDQRFQADGFDWEVTPASPGRAGALAAQRSLAGHGQVLEIQYTGRAVSTPIVRQYLFLGAGRYTLRGQYMTSKLRMEQGLAWAVRCTESTHAVAGRSGPLQDTAAAWQNFQFEFNVPAGCGAAASLELETFAPFEAAVGFTGKASFDNLQLLAEP